MINNSKITENTLTTQVACILPSDSNIEFAGIKETKEVVWIQRGHTLAFKYLPKWAYRICQHHYLNDLLAVAQLSALDITIERQVELYVYHLWGDVDATADIINHRLQPNENFRDTPSCSSLDWDSKWITIDGVALTKRDLIIIDMIKQDALDTAIADALEISVSTLGFHKKNLFEKCGVQTKTELIVKALNQHV
jgi:DNA-binding CsgD family transcriptional regulator